jgi:streptogramin lyase
MNNKHHFPKVILLTCIFSLIFNACSTSAQSEETVPGDSTDNVKSTKTEALSNETQIVIEGQGGDWAEYDIIGNDELGDQASGSPDIGEVRGFSNDQFFYLMVWLHENGLTDHYDVLIDVDGGEYDFQASVWPEINQFYFSKFPITNGMKPMQGGQAAQGEVIEVKIPLSKMGGLPVQRIHLQTFLGDQTGDMIPDLRAVITDEIEVIGVETIVDDQPSTPEKPTSEEYCQGDPFPRIPNFNIELTGASAEMLWQTQFVPWWVRTGPDGKVYAVTDGGDTIYEIEFDGTLSPAFTCPGVNIETGIMASDGAFWFASRDGKIFRADPGGIVRLMDQSGSSNLEAGPEGSVYGQGNGMIRIDMDGKKTNISSSAQGRKFAVSSIGEVATLKDGKVYLITEGGEMRELASGYGPEEWLTFGPDGKLYVTHWSGVDVIDLADGSVKPLDWLVNACPGEAGTFAPDGRLLVYHPNTNVWAINLQAQTIDVYYQVVSNSWAMGVSPDGEVYVAFGSKQGNGETTIYRVSDQQTLELIVNVPYGNENSMAFDLDGTGYIGVSDSKKGVMIYSFDPESGSFEEYFRPECCPNTMAVNPTDGRVWWGDCGNFASVDENGQKEVIQGVSGSENSSLAITTEGEFYALVFFPRDDPNTAYSHYIYHLNPNDSQWEEIADITQSDPGITMAKIVGCADGRVYTVESLGPENLPVDRSSYNGVRRLEANGSLTLVGFDFSFDGQGGGCDYANNRVVFTSGTGIFAVKIHERNGDIRGEDAIKH